MYKYFNKYYTNSTQSDLINFIYFYHYLFVITIILIIINVEYIETKHQQPYHHQHRQQQQHRQLSSTSRIDSAFELEFKQSMNWQPKLPTEFKSDFKHFHLYDRVVIDLSNSLIQQSHLGIDGFYLSSVTIFNSVGYRNLGYILLGGAYQTQNRSAVLRENGQMFLCHLDFLLNDASKCVSLNTYLKLFGQHNYLGFSSRVLTLDQEHILIVYCDPLWHANFQVPVGRCFAQILSNEKIMQTVEIGDICQTGGQLAIPCAAGYSIDLNWDTVQQPLIDVRQNLENLLKHVNLWIGQPLAIPYGRIQVIKDLFNSTQMITTFTKQDNQTLAALFGYALMDGFATAPGLPYMEEYNHTNFVQLMSLQFSQSNRKTIQSYITSDWSIETNASEYFSGYGLSITTVKLASPYLIGIVVGAPYTGKYTINDNSLNNDEVDTTQNRTTKNQKSVYNQGRIYLYCLTNSQQYLNNKYFKTDYLDAPDGITNFGYSLTNMNDLDGDGNEDIAVGAPNLNKLPQNGRVYIIKILSNCHIDRVPLQILYSPLGTNDFGAYLPPKSIDLDFNLNPDLVIPFNHQDRSISNSNIQIYGRRQLWLAECHYTLPAWLTIRRILKNDVIPLQLIVYFLDPINKFKKLTNLEQIFPSSQITNQLYHQINSDINVTMHSNRQPRFILVNQIETNFDYTQNNLIVQFQIKAQQNVEDMHDLGNDHGEDNSDNGVFIGYRFLQSCTDNDQYQQSGKCGQDNRFKYPLIDWSNCLTKLPLVQYVCYPSAYCEGDVSMRITDQQSNIISSIIPSSNKTINISLDNEGKDQISEQFVQLQYANKNMSRQQLLIEIFNYGPTFAHGVELILQFYGNLKFSRLEYLVKSVGKTDRLEPVMVDVTANESWVNCDIGTLAPPLTNSQNSNVDWRSVSPIHTFILSTYYDQFMSSNDGIFTKGASVKIDLLTGTIDPDLRGNSMQFHYEVVHKPLVRISYGPVQDVSSRMDNRSKPTGHLPGEHQRVLVSDLGPKIENTLQIEYLGPGMLMRNVSIKLMVPIELNVHDKITSQPPYLFYMFNEIRAPGSQMQNANEDMPLEWVDTKPKIIAMGKFGESNISKVGKCVIMNYDQVVNPRRMIGMHIDNVYSRNRRSILSDNEKDASTGINKSVLNTTNESDKKLDTITTTHHTATTKRIPVIEFRRLQKEIIQCDRIGNRIQKPICAEIVCQVNELVKNRPVLVKITGWLWARTLFAKHISDVDLVTTLTMDQGQIPDGVKPQTEPIGIFYLAQTFFFPQIRPKLLHQIPIWPIIVGIVAGVIVLYMIIILLYLLGFFRRRRPALKHKAKLTTGVADELSDKEQQNESNLSLNCSLLDGEIPPKKSLKSPKKKRRKEISILHPSDLRQRQELEEQTLIPNSNT